MIDSSAFYSAVSQLDQSVRDLMELTREEELPEVTNGVRRYYAEDGKCPFQVSRQFDRPDEYLQALLDMIRVQYEPHPMGTMMLNSNVTANLWQVIEQGDIGFGYLSMVSEDKQSFTDFWQTEITDYANKCGYRLQDARLMFVVVTAGMSNYALPLLAEVNYVLDSGLTIKEAVKALAGGIVGETGSGKEVHAGFCLDEAMGERLRVSVWLIE
jgi:hypothetical protein